MKKTKVDPQTNSSSFKIHPHIHEYLLKLRIPCHLEGYKYIAYIIQNYAELVPDWKFTYLYSKVGKELGSTSARVERALRNSIRKSWRDVTDEFLRVQFNSDSPFNIPPVASHYITAVCYDYLSHMEDSCEKGG